jgi:hypothetical protein
VGWYIVVLIKKYLSYTPVAEVVIVRLHVCVRMVCRAGLFPEITAMEPVVNQFYLGHVDCQLYSGVDIQFSPGPLDPPGV